MDMKVTPSQFKSWREKDFKDVPKGDRFGAGVVTFNPGGFMQAHEVSVCDYEQPGH
jgi:hypothetical protein